MQSLPLLSLLIFLPLIGAGFVLFARTPSNARQTAFLVSILTFFLSLIILQGFQYQPNIFQYIEHHPWLPNFGFAYTLGIDGLSLSLILLTTFLIPVCILSSWETLTQRVKEFYVAFLLLESFTIGTFCALNLVLFYIFFEAVLIPMFFIIGIWGGNERLKATFKFFLYTLAGSLCMLVALIHIIFETGTSDLQALFQYEFQPSSQYLLWAAFFVAFAIKIPMFPVHTWLPDAHSEAPTAGSIILAGILLKMGGYGMIRLCLGLFPQASLYYKPFVLILSIIAVGYASLVAWRQEDMKRLIAYSSIAHMGYVTAGIFLNTIYGLQGSMVQMISHGLISAALFLCVGIIYDRTHTRQIRDYGGVIQSMPKYCYGLLFFTMASIGLPGTSGFIGEFLVIIAAYWDHILTALGLATGMVLGAVYMLSLYKKIALGPVEHNQILKLTDVNKREYFLILILGIGILILGIFPKFLTQLLDCSHIPPAVLGDSDIFKQNAFLSKTEG